MLIKAFTEDVCVKLRHCPIIKDDQHYSSACSTAIGLDLMQPVVTWIATGQLQLRPSFFMADLKMNPEY